MAQGDQAILEFRAGSLTEQDLAVTRLVGREELSAPYAFDVEFHERYGEPLELADLQGTDALLTLRATGGAERFVHGIVWVVEMAGVAAGKPSYRAQLVPALQRLVHVRRSRIFQSMSVPDIVAKVLKEGKVEHRASLSGSYAPREFCVQYREGDLAFVSRLLEEEGIFYFFEHGQGEHVMVLADAPNGFVPIAGEATVPFRILEQSSVHEKEEHLSGLEQAQRLRPGKVLLQDFDFERPALRVQGTAQESGATSRLEHDEYPGGFVDPGAGKRLARVRLQELRRDAAAFSGEGNSLRFLPGATFEVAEHPDTAFNARLNLLGVTHQASQTRGAATAGGVGHDYRNEFEAQEASLPIRPARRTRRPTAYLETATVVGPAGEEIHPDQHGRVKVKLHWDREGKRDEKASCWIRCAQSWAGAAWGASYTPRIGQEVLVRFLEGNPDRPVIAGAVYNGQNPPPVQLPADRTQSALRSDSSLGSGGFNELRFEDLQGAEQLSIHAQMDERIEVGNDKTQRIDANESLTVSKDRSLQVDGQQELAVVGDDTGSIGGSRTLTVGGDRSTTVEGAQRETVAVAQTTAVAGSRQLTADLGAAESVGAAAALNVGAAYAVNVGGVLNKAVGGLFSGQVVGARVEVVGLRREERVAKDSTATVAGDFAQEVAEHAGRNTTGDHQENVDGEVGVEVVKGVTWTAKEFKLEADKLTIAVDGKAVISIDSSGKITFGVSKLLVEGNTLTLKGSKIEKSAAGSAASATPKVAKLQPMKGDKAFVEIVLKDQDGNPVANEWFKMEFPDGTVKEGRTGGSGKAWVPGPKEGNVKVSFLGVDEKAWKKS